MWPGAEAHLEFMLVHAYSREGGEGCGEPESVLSATVASQLCGLVASWVQESPVLPDLPFCLSFFSCVYLFFFF